MLQTSLVALGVGTLCAVVSALNGSRPIEIDPAPEPRPAYLALTGEMVDMAAETYGEGCFVPTLDEIRRHPNWLIRLDHIQWDWNGEDKSVTQRLATLVIDGETATWRDPTLLRSLTLTGQERRDVLAAFALDCREDASRAGCGNGGRYVGIGLGEDGPVLARFIPSSSVNQRLQELFYEIEGRYVAGRVDDLNGFSLELARTTRTGRDDQGRPIQPFRIVFPGRDAVSRHLALWTDLLDWAMTQPASLPPGDGVVRGTLRAHGTSRPIAVDLAKLDPWLTKGGVTFHELGLWEEIERLRSADARAIRGTHD